MAIVITTAVAAAFDTAATAAVDDSLATSLGTNAVLQIRTGAAAGPGGAAGGTLLASVTIASWTAATPAPGQVTGADPGAVTASASGTAAHFRLQTSGAVAVLEGSVGTAAADLILDNTAIVSGGSVDLGAPVLTVPVTAPTA
ncbi:MAG: hypothetical protein ACRDPS_08760 [Nocardioides sp.]|uniref:hypothetical protein n=1 Tax=Nocardioides sp. TaxID=35761 RepID=UPI003D6BC2E8